MRRNEAWRKTYYDLFERAKKEPLAFEDILRYMYEQTGNIEPSFSSKMLVTLNPEKPIWDRYVVQNLKLELTGSKKAERVENAIALYSDIEKWYEEFLRTEKAKACLETFDRLLSDYAWLSRVKKIDCILWSLR